MTKNAQGDFDNRPSKETVSTLKTNEQHYGKQTNGKSSKPIIPLFIEHKEKVHYD